MVEPLSLYGAVALSRVGLQIGTSAIERSKNTRRRRLPAATLIVACYNEPIDMFEKAAQSLKQLNYRGGGIEVIVVDDGSSNHADIKRISQKYGHKYIYQRNAGKREAMFTGIEAARPESTVLMFSDSDTVWDRDAARYLVRTLLADDKTGAVTGEVAVINHNDNLLTRLIGMRYHMAFAHERASQSFFKTVTCVSGPLGAYRREVIDDIKHRFVNQQFMGRACTYGDDRHLTNLVLDSGYQVRYANDAICYTYAPTEFRVLVKQQTRWSKSYWREIFWQLRVLPKHSWFMTYDWVVSAVLPFILVFSIAWHLAHAVDGSWVHIIILLLTIIGMSLIRVIEPMIRKRDPWYMMFVVYAFMYFSVMLPAKFWALVTINDGKWGSRQTIDETSGLEEIA